MLFVVSSNVEKVDPATRKLIRSHARRVKPSKPRRRDEERKFNTASHVPVPPVKLEEVVDRHVLLLPGRIGSDLSFVKFTDEIEPTIALNIMKVSKIANQIMYPLIVGLGFQTENHGSLYPLEIDAAALHITAFAVQGFVDRVLRREDVITPAALLHFQRGLRLLRERLSQEDDNMRLSDTTMSLVLKLATTAHFDGDFRVSKQHMKGLRKMVDLRGGLAAFKGNSLLAEMLRCDLSIALLTGTSPVFFNQPFEPVIKYPPNLLSRHDEKLFSSTHFELFHHLDDNLAIAWRVMRRFCLLANVGKEIQRPIYPTIIQETMVAVTYRLLYMRFATGSLDEAVRLGMLAFCHHTFMQWQDIKPPNRYFPRFFRSCILAFKDLHGDFSSLILWLLMIAAISLFDVAEEAWLRECLNEYMDRCHVKTWDDMQAILKSFLWLKILDEEPGMSIYIDLVSDGEKH